MHTELFLCLTESYYVRLSWNSNNFENHFTGFDEILNNCENDCENKRHEEGRIFLDILSL